MTPRFRKKIKTQFRFLINNEKFHDYFFSKVQKKCSIRHSLHCAPCVVGQHQRTQCPSPRRQLLHFHKHKWVSGYLHFEEENRSLFPIISLPYFAFIRGRRKSRGQTNPSYGNPGTVPFKKGLPRFSWILLRFLDRHLLKTYSTLSCRGFFGTPGPERYRLLWRLVFLTSKIKFSKSKGMTLFQRI